MRECSGCHQNIEDCTCSDDYERMEKKRMKEKYPVITICGSSKQKADWEYYQKKLALEGNVVLAINIYLGLEATNYNDDNEVKRLLMELHRQKIRMADKVCFIRKPDGTLGDHTTTEYDYAVELKKPILFVDSLNMK